MFTTEELKRDLCRVAQPLGHPPARFEYAAHGNFDAETVRRRSGQRNWENAVAAVSGLNVEQIKSGQARGGYYRTTEEWLRKLRELSVQLGHAPTTKEANAAGINGHQLSLRVGGKWIEVLIAAKIDRRKVRNAPHC
jgi:hypothetical protein